MVAFHVIYFDRAESSETYMKSHMGNVDAFFLYFFKKVIIPETASMTRMVIM